MFLRAGSLLILPLLQIPVPWAFAATVMAEGAASQERDGLLVSALPKVHYCDDRVVILSKGNGIGNHELAKWLKANEGSLSCTGSASTISATTTSTTTTAAAAATTTTTTTTTTTNPARAGSTTLSSPSSAAVAVVTGGVVVAAAAAAEGGTAHSKPAEGDQVSSAAGRFLFRGPLLKAMVGLVAVLRTKEALLTLPVMREYVGVIHGRLRRTLSAKDSAVTRDAQDTGTAQATSAAEDHRRCVGEFLGAGESHIFEQSFGGSDGSVEQTEVTVRRIVRSNSSGFLSIIHLRPIAQSSVSGAEAGSNAGKDRNPNLDFHHERLRELMYTLGCPIIGTIGRTRKLRNQKCSGICLSCVSIAVPTAGNLSSIESANSTVGAAHTPISDDEWIVARVEPPERFNAICDKELSAWQRRQAERRASGENCTSLSQVNLNPDMSVAVCSKPAPSHQGGLDVALPHYPESQLFFNLPFHVSPAVMIPRRSSEAICTRAKDVLTAALKTADDALQRKISSGGRGDDREAHAPQEDYGQVISVLDLGTGSGCLLLASLHGFPASRVRGVGVDLSSGALEVARENARRLNMTKQVRFVQCGFQEVSREKLEPAMLKGNGISPEPCPPFRLCICNPPYLVKRHGMAVLDAAVVENEPGMALFVEGADPLVHYRTVLETVYRPYKQMMLQRAQTSPAGRVGGAAAELASDIAPRPKKPRLQEGMLHNTKSAGPVSVMSPHGATFLFEAPP